MSITSALFVLLLFVCLAWWKAAIGIREGGGVVPVTLELFTSSLPSAISLSHLAVKWRNVFKASSSFTGALTTSSCADVAVCVVYVCVCCVLEGLESLCVLPGSHSMLLFLENPLDGEVCCLKSHTYCQK